MRDYRGSRAVVWATFEAGGVGGAQEQEWRRLGRVEDDFRVVMLV